MALEALSTLSSYGIWESTWTLADKGDPAEYLGGREKTKLGFSPGSGPDTWPLAVS